MRRAFHSEPVSSLLARSPSEVLKDIIAGSAEFGFSVNDAQRSAWAEEVGSLVSSLTGIVGQVYFEFEIPRMDRRADVVLLLGGAVVVLEFKTGKSGAHVEAVDQVWDYALDLKNFHQPTHDLPIIPIVVASGSVSSNNELAPCDHPDRVWNPVIASLGSLPRLLHDICTKFRDNPVDRDAWEQGRYSPTPTIVEAARVLYAHHSVSEISRSDAGATNLAVTANSLDKIIVESRSSGEKAICLVTGVPGAGKTLVGLTVATAHSDKNSELHSVYLSGNGPLVQVLREALARDKAQRDKESGRKGTLKEARSQVKTFIQNVHNFRDEYLRDAGPPDEHVAIFDEAQRAWDLEQTARFMLRRKGHPGFKRSEPEFLISCMDRLSDWGVIVCLVGEGQEINTGEAGITEWVASINRAFPNWRVYAPKHILSDRYGSREEISRLAARKKFELRDGLHLSTSLRSFRAGSVAALVDAVLDGSDQSARKVKPDLAAYPIMLTRSLPSAKAWVKARARGSERYGMLVSSSADRLKPQAIDVRVTINPLHWFLGNKTDTRSSYYLEDAATEFQVQGLELDWACVVWDADLRLHGRSWQHWSFSGARWKRVSKASRQVHLENAYRVLLTRARQGMAIVVPEGDPTDPTRLPEFYDPTYSFLESVGLCVL